MPRSVRIAFTMRNPEGLSHAVSALEQEPRSWRSRQCPGSAADGRHQVPNRVPMPSRKYACLFLSSLSSPERARRLRLPGDPGFRRFGHSGRHCQSHPQTQAPSHSPNTDPLYLGRQSGTPATAVRLVTLSSTPCGSTPAHVRTTERTGQERDQRRNAT